MIVPLVSAKTAILVSAPELFMTTDPKVAFPFPTLKMLVKLLVVVGFSTSAPATVIPAPVPSSRTAELSAPDSNIILATDCKPVMLRVEPGTITAVSAAVGTTPPAQELASAQLVPVVVERMLAALPARGLSIVMPRANTAPNNRRDDDVKLRLFLMRVRRWFLMKMWERTSSQPQSKLLEAFFPYPDGSKSYDCITSKPF